MKLRKIIQTQSKVTELAIEVDGVWKLIEDSDGELLSFLNQSLDDICAAYQLIDFDEADYEDVLPFQPAAYRDFMLYEQHAIDAARGFVKKYMPKVFPIVSMIEKITGKPFSKLKPSKRYYQYPIYYLGNHLNFITHNQPVEIPRYTRELDYELEIAAVLTKPLKNATPDEVTDAIGGFVILNDFSARDVQLSEMQSGFGPMKSKNFANAISSVVVSADELLPLIDELTVSVRINDEVVATSSSKNKRYSFQEAIAYASWEEQLHPGELFGSGTIPGCAGIENGRLLNKGDCICLEVETLGKLTTTVI